MIRLPAYVKIAAFSFTGVCAACLVQALRPARFESVAAVTIKAGGIADDELTGAPIASDFGESFFQSRFLAEAAHRRLHPRFSAGSSIHIHDDGVATWQAGLQVRRSETDRRVLDIRYTADSPESARAALESLLEAADELLYPGREQEEARLKFLRSTRDEMLAEAGRKKQALQEFQNAAPPEWPGRETFERQRAELELWERRREAIQALASESPPPSASMGSGSHKTVESEGTRSLPPSVAPASSAASPQVRGAVLIELLAEEASLLERYGVNHPKVKSIRARIETFQIEAGVETELSRLQAEEKLLRETYGPQHPKVVSIRSRIAALGETERGPASPPNPPDPAARNPVPLDSSPSNAASIDKPTHRSTSSAIDGPSATTPNEISDRKPAASPKELEELTLQIARRRAIFDDLSEWNTLETNLRRDADEAREKYEIAESRFVEASEARSKQGKIVVVLSGPESGTPVARRFWPYSLVGGLAGALLGLIPLRGSTSKRKGTARTPALETASAMRLPPPQDTAGVGTEGDGVPAWMVVHHRPQSYEANIYRALRTALRFAGRASDRNFAVLCLSPSDDSRIIAVNLAAAFALADRRTLLIDDLPKGDSVTAPPTCDAATAADDQSFGQGLIGSIDTYAGTPRLAVAQVVADWESVPRDELVQLFETIHRDYDVAIYCTDSVRRVRLFANIGMYGGAVVVSPSTASDDVLAGKVAEYSAALDRTAVEIVKYNPSST